MRDDDTTVIQASLTAHSLLGHSIHDVERVDASNIHHFVPDTGRRQRAMGLLKSLGFTVDDHGGSTLTVRGTRELFERSFRRRLIDRHAARPRMKRTTPRYEVDRATTPGLIPISRSKHQELASLARGLALSEPVKLFGAAAEPPLVRYPHVQLPHGLAAALNAKVAHEAGWSGRGIRVATCDTGFFRHPWFVQQQARVRVTLTPGAEEPEADDIGHGTMVAANLLSIAPKCDVRVIKMKFSGEESFSLDSVVALTMAEASNADIVSCSWGISLATAKNAASAHVRTVEFVLARLVSEKRIVLCATGNFPRGSAERGEFGFPGQHPDVIAVGGARITPRGQLRAASYASAFRSEVYPYRSVPDVCGICGDLPAGVLIMSPVQPGCRMDEMAALNRYPNGDNTATDDGWCCVSGTSAATPQVAGAAALVLESNRALRHNQTMRAVLELTAREVRAGTSNPRAVRSGLSNDAHRGPDLATGVGLVDVGAAVELAKWLGRKKSAISR